VGAWCLGREAGAAARGIGITLPGGLLWRV
jgi:hypothetical protein